MFVFWVFSPFRLLPKKRDGKDIVTDYEAQARSSTKSPSPLSPSRQASSLASTSLGVMPPSTGNSCSGLSHDADGGVIHSQSENKEDDDIERRSGGGRRNIAT